MLLNQGLRAGMFAGLFCGSAWCSTAAAANIQVCPTCTHKTVQSAVNAAVSGDLIFVAAGVYVENVTIAGKDVTIYGADDWRTASTVIVGAGRGPVFTLGDAVVGSPTYSIALHNLTITGGLHTNATGEGGGIQVRRGAALALFNSIVAHNVATYGAGISFNNPDTTDNFISNSSIEWNSAIAPGSGATVATGGGIAILSGGADIQGATVVHNDAINGGGIYAARGTQMQLHVSTLSLNKAHQYATATGGLGGGLFVAGSYSIFNDEITGNSSDGLNGGGGGIYLDASTAVDTGGGIHDSMIARNSNGWGVGGGISISNGLNKTVTLTKDYIVQNVGDGITNTAALVATDTIIRDNSGQNCTGGTGCPN